MPGLGFARIGNGLFWHLFSHLGTQFDNADLSGADLRRAWLYHGDLSKSNLNGTDLSTTKVWYHQIQKAILCNTKSRFWGVINSGCVAM